MANALAAIMAASPIIGEEIVRRGRCLRDVFGRVMGAIGDRFG